MSCRGCRGCQRPAPLFAEERGALGDLLPCDSTAAMAGIRQVETLVALYTRAPAPVKARYTVEVSTIRRDFGDLSKMKPNDLGWLNCDIRDLGAKAEIVSKRMAADIGRATGQDGPVIVDEPGPPPGALEKAARTIAIGLGVAAAAGVAAVLLQGKKDAR